MLILAGFVAGGYIISSLIRLFQFNIPVNPQVIFLLCGLIGAALVTSLFDWAVIALSSISGAALVADNLRLSLQNATVLILVLVVFGIAVQAGWLRWGKRTVVHRQERTP
jgi:divalent metal cation (Fe/Co/Zn/Cd) transporter